jgi:hypothetical protein
MESKQPAPRSSQLENAERLLAESGHDLGLFRTRVAAGRTGIVVGFPQDPMLHISWAVLAGLAALAVVSLSRRS